MGDLLKSHERDYLQAFCKKASGPVVINSGGQSFWIRKSGGDFFFVRRYGPNVGLGEVLVEPFERNRVRGGSPAVGSPPEPVQKVWWKL